MDGLTKLKLALVILLMLMIIGLAASFFIATIEEDKFVDEYQKLSYDDQQVLANFYDKLPDYTNLYTIIGFMYYAVAGGLFLLLTKIWYLKKIWLV